MTEAVIAADLVNTLSTNDNITVFAPTNSTFANLLKELKMSKEELLNNKELLQKVLTYHVVSGSIYRKDVKAGGEKNIMS